VALSQAGLSSKIETELKAVYGEPADATKLKSFCDAVAKAVVDEIKANAQAAGTCLVTAGSSAGTYQVTVPAGGIT